MDLIIKITAVGLVTAIVALLLKKSLPEMALLLVAAVSIFALAAIMSLMSSVSTFVDSLWELSGVSKAVLLPLLKVIAVAIICKLGSDVCKDASQGALASVIELAGTVTALYLSLPLMNSAVDMLISLTGE